MKFKVSVIKKNQILTWSVIIMLLIAGFLNYQSDPKRNYDIEVTNMMDENLGDAILVDSNNLVTNTEDLLADVSSKNLKYTSDEFFSENRIMRNNQYAEQIETYENILKDTNISDEQKRFASEEIKRINDEKNAISISENLIKLKGIEEAVILVNKDSVNVIALDENLDEAKVAKIQNIIQNELKVDIKNIHISELKSNDSGD